MSHVRRTIFNATGPGVQQDDTRPGAMSGPWQHVHQARVRGNPVYDQLSGPVVLQDGVRVTYGYRPLHPEDKQPVLFEFDSTKYSEAASKRILSSMGVREYVWQPDSADMIPPTGVNPREQDQKAPAGWPSLQQFLENTIAVD
jgi:hypothetical protein